MARKDLSSYLSFLSSEADFLINERTISIESLDALAVEVKEFKQWLINEETIDSGLKRLVLDLDYQVNLDSMKRRTIFMYLRRLLPFGWILVPMDFRQTRAELIDFRKKVSHLAFMFQ